MIDLSPGRAPLSRVVRDLGAQAPARLPGPPDLSAHGADDRRAARAAWATRIVDEYRSVVVFSDLLRMLAELEAPLSTQIALHRLIGDELRHTQLCAEVAGWFGPLDDLEIDLSDLSLPPDPSARAPAARALEIVVRELCVAESESVIALCAYRDAAREPAVRAALEILLCDEVRHASVGRALAEALFLSLPAADLADLPAALPALVARDRAELRRFYSATTSANAKSALGASITPADLDRARHKMRRLAPPPVGIAVSNQ